VSSLAERIAERLETVKITPADLARAVKVKPPSVSAWLSGDTKTIKGENLLRAAQALRCSPHWLATGIGPKHGSDTPPAAAARDPGVSYLTDPLIEEAAEILRNLDRHARLEAMQWLRGYAAGRKIEPWASNGPGHPVARKTRRT